MMDVYELSLNPDVFLYAWWCGHSRSNIVSVVPEAGLELSKKLLTARDTFRFQILKVLSLIPFGECLSYAISSHQIGAALL
jgi:hypothetical protein